jgi:hypothetical protein
MLAAASLWPGQFRDTGSTRLSRLRGVSAGLPSMDSEVLSVLCWALFFTIYGISWSCCVPSLQCELCNAAMKVATYVSLGWRVFEVPGYI